MMKRLCVCLALLPGVVAQGQDVGETPPFELKDGDRVIFLGSEFTEQAIKHNYLEAELTARWPERRVSFFNMGWSGDTPSGIARGYFGGAEEGFRRLSEEIDRIRPTVVFLCYGSNFDGASTEQFAKDFNRLRAKVREHTQRIVIVTPPPVEARPRPRPSASILNTRRRAATRMLKFLFVNEIDDSRFVNLFGSLERRLRSPNQPLTWDGLRFTAEGYRLISDLMLRVLKVPDTDDRLGFSEARFERLRELIAEKNQLYFHRYRPQNETYLRGFRKHEQGQNAKEIAEFDALIKLAEDRVYAFLNNREMPPPIPEPPPIELSFEALDPEAERADFTLGEGLEIALFAAEPMVANPIHMQFDGSGRLWVATSPIYPHIKPGAKPRDEIVILEDTDGDHVADKRTVFADDLLIPTAVLPDERGGAYVANSTELIHLADTDGDGRADRRRVVLAGFGTEDTHHILHTFRWGPDGAVYFNQSIYIHTHAETPVGVRRLMGSGIWRFTPDTGVAEVVMRGLVNPWGHVFDDYGQSFATDGAGGDGINYAFLGAAYPTAVGFPRVLRGMNPGQPKHCGLEIVTGRHWPEEWQGTLVTNDFRGNRINRFRPAPEGSGYTSTQLPDLLTSRHRAFRPVDIKAGPDNALYIADWYNPIINHGEVDFRDSRRDYKHGRIWRVTMSGREVVTPPNFEKASVPELLEMLKLPEQRTRHLARIELTRRNRFDVRSELYRWTEQSSEDYDLQLEALWVNEAIGSLNLQLLRRLLQAPDHRHRAAAVRTLGHLGRRVDGAMDLLTITVQDSHPQVRLEALGALRAFPSKQSAELAMLVMNKPMDKYLDFALWLTMRDLERHWFPGDGTDFSEDPQKLLFALRAIGKPGIANPLLRLLKSGKLSGDEQNQVAQLLGEYGGPQHLARMFELAVEQEARRGLLLTALMRAARRGARPEGDLSPLEGLQADPQALQLAGLWKYEPLRPVLRQQAVSGSGQIRSAAIRGLAAFRDADGLLAVIESGLPVSVRRQAVAEYATFDEAAAAERAAEILSALGPDRVADAEQLVGAFVSRRNGATALAKALADRKLVGAIAAAGSRRASSGGRSARGLVDVFRRIGSITPMKTELTPAELAALIEQVQTTGDPARGESVYRRKSLACIKCHAIGGAGGVVGPDMVSLGASSPIDYIVESMLKPSAKIKEGYHTTTIVDDDGRQISGRVLLEDDERVVLRDAEDKEHVVLKSSIDERVQSPTSLMPVDLLAALPRDDFVDLIAFLSALGRDGPFKVPANRFVRRWILEDGSVVYSRVSGALPVADIRGSTVTCEIEVTTAGSVAIEVFQHDGLRITRNDLTDNLRAARIVQDLPVGRHQFHFRVPGNRKAPMRVEVVPVPQSAGRAVPVNR